MPADSRTNVTQTTAAASNMLHSRGPMWSALVSPTRASSPVSKAAITIISTTVADDEGTSPVPIAKFKTYFGTPQAATMTAT